MKRKVIKASKAREMLDELINKVVDEDARFYISLDDSKYLVEMKKCSKGCHETDN